MSDAGREFADLKREIVEARNQAIKTDNQVKNLTLDIKGFERRFDGLEGRMRLTSIGVNLIVAVTIALAAYVASSVRIKALDTELQASKAAIKDEREAAAAKSEDIHAKLAESEKKRREHQQAAETATQILSLLDNKQEAQAAELLDKLDMNQLLPLERKITEKRFGDLRRRNADVAYRNGRSAVSAGRYEAAVPELRRALTLDTEGRNTLSGHYLLATGLYGLQHYDEALPLWRDLSKSDDRTVAEEARYYIAAALAHLGRRDEAKKLFQQMSSNTRFGPQAKTYAVALESEADLPVDLPGARVRAGRKSPTGEDTRVQ